jgi:hypothetical protein
MAVASFTLVRFPTAIRPTARVPLDRRVVRRLPGARFAKLLGTGRGRTMSASADLRRWSLFVVWDDDDAREAFRTEHPMSRRWDATADERYDVTLLPLGAHGTWDGVDPIAGAAGAAGDGPVAVLTRATVRWRQVPSFLRAVPAVDRTLAGTDGLLATVGIGELPVGRQATFSLWRDAEAVRAFAYQQAEHTDVIRRTRDEGWYAEEWFARFRPTASSGTWDGRDPLG